MANFDFLLVFSLDILTHLAHHIERGAAVWLVHKKHITLWINLYFRELELCLMNDLMV